MLWEKSKVDAYKHNKELSLRPPFAEGGPRNSGESESHPGKDREDCPHR